MLERVEERSAFVFPQGMSYEAAQQILQAAYEDVDEGKLLRRTNKLLRKRGIDPPMHVQYVAEPIVLPMSHGWSIGLGCDIMIYEEFPEMDDCRRAFEESLQELLLARLEKRLKQWQKGR